MKALLESLIAPAETKRNAWFITVPHATPIDDLFKPEFYIHIAYRLTVGDHIECLYEDGTLFIELMVTAVAERVENKAPSWANVVELRRVPLVRAEDKKLSLPQGFVTKWRGGAKWSVMRLGETPDKDVVIIEKQHSEADAIREFQKMKSKMVG